jgi:hypothetical protein
VAESDLDILTPPLSDADAVASASAGTASRSAVSVLGFVGVSVGFAALLGLSFGAVAALWVTLFGQSVLTSPIVLWCGWVIALMFGGQG